MQDAQPRARTLAYSLPLNRAQQNFMRNITHTTAKGRGQNSHSPLPLNGNPYFPDRNEPYLKAWQGGTDLSSQDLGGRGRRSRSLLAIWLDLDRIPCLIRTKLLSSLFCLHNTREGSKTARLKYIQPVLELVSASLLLDVIHVTQELITFEQISITTINYFI